MIATRFPTRPCARMYTIHFASAIMHQHPPLQPARAAARKFRPGTEFIARFFEIHNQRGSVHLTIRTRRSSRWPVEHGPFPKFMMVGSTTILRGGRNRPLCITIELTSRLENLLHGLESFTSSRRGSV